MKVINAKNNDMFIRVLKMLDEPAAKHLLFDCLTYGNEDIALEILKSRIFEEENLIDIFNCCGYGKGNKIIKYIIGNYNVIDISEQLWHACCDTDEEKAEIMIKAGANVDYGTGHPLGASCESGSFELVKMLVEAGANIDIDNGYAIRNAVEIERFDIAEYLIEQGATINDDVIEEAETEEVAEYLCMKRKEINKIQNNIK